jgi:FtsP/CotA-like multicopper oxidase with cupredoxin domain
MGSRASHQITKRVPLQSSRDIDRTVGFIILGLLLSVNAVSKASAQQASSEQLCPRPLAGAAVTNPPELRSHNGVLELGLHLRYQRTQVSQGPPRYCYVTDDGLESPTLRVSPGDHLIIHLHNDLPPDPPNVAKTHAMDAMDSTAECAGGPMNSSSTNLHFHGMTIPAVCHQDEVIHTVVQAGQSFDYHITIPADEPPGLYWYHPHPHGFSERQVQGGASGALIVEGIEKTVPFVASLQQRVIVLRDLQRIGPEPPGPLVPTWDVSANFVPIAYPDSVPALLEAPAGRRELWRVVNAASDTIFDLQLLINQVTQTLQVLAFDAAPIAAHGYSKLRAQDHVVLPPGARAEFVVTTPAAGQGAELITQAWATGPDGDNDTKRTIAKIETVSDPGRVTQISTEAGQAGTLSTAQPGPATLQRRLYFSQRSSNVQDPDSFVLYFITVDGQSPAPYKMDLPPNIVTHQGDIEEWTIENRSQEDHVFHIHQVHFQVLEADGKLVKDDSLRDTIDVPYWSGKGPYPSVKLRMDFSGPDTVGTFLYHCHILKHEDMGMMGSIEVLPARNAK